MLADVIIRSQVNFVFLIFVVRANHDNILTTKISRSTVTTKVSQKFLSSSINTSP